MLQERLELLFGAVAGADSVLILPHNDPDPDAIASTLALRHLLKDKLGLEGHIAYKGIIGRAENEALVRYLGHPLRRLASSDLRQSVPIALIYTQPGAGNNALPPKSTVAVVLDHHPWREAAAAARFADVRPNIGATSTRIYDGVVISYMGPMGRPDLAAEMADLLLRLQGIRWMICMGMYKDHLILAVRTRSRRGGAEQLVQEIVGDRGTAGGHGTMAGGQVHPQGGDPERVARQFSQRALQYLQVPPEIKGQPLIDA